MQALLCYMLYSSGKSKRRQIAALVQLGDLEAAKQAVKEAEASVDDPKLVTEVCTTTLRMLFNMEQASLYRSQSL